MELLSTFDASRAGDLTIVRHGWVRPYFTLTDGINTYGELTYIVKWRKTGNLKMAGQNWIIEPQKLFKREIIVKDSLIGQPVSIVKTSLWREQSTLMFPESQVLTFKREGVFSKKHSWYSEQYGKLLTIESKLMSNKTPFKITLEPNAPKNNINLVLITFIGVHLILLRRAHAAAH